MTTELRHTPLVSVVTPFYNTARYLAECIDSVLSQRTIRFEYLLVNNCSTDGSREIACTYAEKDPRIRLIDNRRFVGQVENYNGALAHIDPASKYVKLIQADDRLFPDCLLKMVEVAERDRRIGIVASQYLMGDEVYGLDFPVRASQVSGRKVCRDMLLSGRFYLGSPTTVLYRADVVRSRRPFYALGRFHEDTEAAYEILLEYDLGFVHDVLSFMRVERASLTGATRRFGGEILDYLINIERYGNSLLSDAEFRELRTRQWAVYGDFLGTAVLRRREKAFWDYHRRGLATIGRQLRRRDLVRNTWRHVIYVARQPFRTALKRLARSALVTLDRGAARDRLRAGDWVEVRSKQEILRTLDSNGQLEGLPFMPQMFHFCGTRLRVIKRAHKTCDTITGTGGRRMRGAVHLEEVRCDGQAYAGCGAACRIFWKEAWLKRLGSEPDAVAAADDSVDIAGCCAEDAVVAGTRAASWTEADPRYVCQATRLLDATTAMSWWDLGQYLEDYESGNVRLREALGVIASVASRVVTARNRYRRAIQATGTRPFDCVESERNGLTVRRIPQASPNNERAADVRHSLTAGDVVRVKPDAVLESSDRDDRHRGLDSDAKLPPCSGAHAVRARVERIIDEQTGRSIPVRPGAVILDGVSCDGRYSEDRMFCPRGIVRFFREGCLEPAPDDERNLERSS
jgi:glycosyltransferase involved in cell wall biosynthesis